MFNNLINKQLLLLLFCWNSSFRSTKPRTDFFEPYRMDNSTSVVFLILECSISNVNYCPLSATLWIFWVWHGEECNALPYYALFHTRIMGNYQGTMQSSCYGVQQPRGTISTKRWGAICNNSGWKEWEINVDHWKTKERRKRSGD